MSSGSEQRRNDPVYFVSGQLDDSQFADWSRVILNVADDAYDDKIGVSRGHPRSVDILAHSPHHLSVSVAQGRTSDESSTLFGRWI